MNSDGSVDWVFLWLVLSAVMFAPFMIAAFEYADGRIDLGPRNSLLVLLAAAGLALTWPVVVVGYVVIALVSDNWKWYDDIR